jgi:hypothetical protein
MILEHPDFFLSKFYFFQNFEKILKKLRKKCNTILSWWSYTFSVYISHITERFVSDLKLNSEILTPNFKKSYLGQFLKILKTIDGLFVP